MLFTPKAFIIILRKYVYQDMLTANGLHFLRGFTCFSAGIHRDSAYTVRYYALKHANRKKSGALPVSACPGNRENDLWP